MYQYSVFLNGGREEQLVVRASTFSELLDGKRNINKVLDKANGNGQNEAYETNGASNGNAHSNGQSLCQHHETKVFTVKKDGANKGREFKSCNQCRAFLGFV